MKITVKTGGLGYSSGASIRLATRGETVDVSEEDARLLVARGKAVYANGTPPATTEAVPTAASCEVNGENGRQIVGATGCEDGGGSGRQGAVPTTENGSSAGDSGTPPATTAAPEYSEANTVKELTALCEKYGVELSGRPNKAAILAALDLHFSEAPPVISAAMPL